MRYIALLDIYAVTTNIFQFKKFPECYKKGYDN